MRSVTACSGTSRIATEIALPLMADGIDVGHIFDNELITTASLKVVVDGNRESYVFTEWGKA